MAILYKLFQDNRKNSSYPGKWYARAIHQNIVGLDDIAERIQRNCSMKMSDVLAVLTEMREVIKDELQASNAVRLDGIGIFSPGIKTIPADTAADFSPLKNIVGYRINFKPASHVQNVGVKTTGGVKRMTVKDWTVGITCKEAHKNAVDTEKKDA